MPGGWKEGRRGAGETGSGGLPGPGSWFRDEEVLTEKTAAPMTAVFSASTSNHLSTNRQFPGSPPDPVSPAPLLCFTSARNNLLTHKLKKLHLDVAQIECEL